MDFNEIEIGQTISLIPCAGVQRITVEVTSILYRTDRSTFFVGRRVFKDGRRGDHVHNYMARTSSQIEEVA